MWIISVLLFPFLIYGLVTGRMPVAGRGGSRVYSRKTEPTWYWIACATQVLLISLGIVGTFRPDIAGSVVDATAPILLVIVLAILATGLRRKPRDGYLGEDQ